MNQRIRYYLNAGIVFFAIGMLFSGDEELIPFFAFVYNFLIFKKLKKHEFEYPISNFKRITIVSISFFITTVIFLVQYQYRNYIDWGCIQTISDIQAGVSYMCYQVSFTIMIWEVGIWFFQGKENETTLKHNIL